MRQKTSLALAGFLALLIFSTLAFGATVITPGTYYVDINQATEGDGSAGSPWKTLHNAISQINGGEVGSYILNVATGTYSFANGEGDYPLSITQSGVTIQGAGAGSTIIDGTDATYWYEGIVIEANDVTLKDLAFKGFSEWGIQIYSGTGRVINSCEIYDNGGEYGGGIYVENSSPEIKQNKIYDNTYGIYVADYIQTTSPNIWNNIIYDTGGNKQDYGIYLYSTGAESIEATIYHNTIDKGSLYGIYIYENTGGSAIPDIKYNVITNFVQYGIYGEPEGHGGSPTIEYNNVYSNSAGNYGGETSDQTGTNGNISQDPLFGSYQLQPSSPCIDAIPITISDPVDLDLEGNTRPKWWGYDMGAYEYQVVDSEPDGMDDHWEIHFFSDTTSHDGTADGDLDGLTDLQEYQNSTDPNDSDSDNDGYYDGEEAGLSTDPADDSDYPSYSPGTYYVNISSGDDLTGDGTSDTPWKTLHHALYRVNGGTAGSYSVNLALGTYSVANGEANDSLAIIQDNVTIIGESGSSPVLDGTDASMWGYGIGIDQDADSITIYNLELSNFSTAGLIIEGTGSSVKNCNIHDNGTGLWIESTASSATIKDNQIHENGAGYYSIGVWIRGASGVTVAGNQIYTHEYYGIGVEDCSPIIQRNEIYGNEWSGIDIWAYTREASPQIANNLIYSGASGITMSAMEESASPAIYHNSIDAGTEDGIYCHGAGATPDIKYNTITNFTGYGICNDESDSGNPVIDYNDIWNNTEGTCSNCAQGTHGISQDPLYGSYELQSASPCIDAIPSNSADPVTVDRAGYARPRDGGFDMGAYEFVADIAYGFTLPGGTGDATDYQMFTVPVSLASGSSLKQGMEGALGAYDKGIWRIFAWNPGTTSYIEMDDPAFAELTVYPGRGFWVISTSTDTITFSGQPAPDGDYTKVPLSSGWNMVALPWPATGIELDNIAVSDGPSSYWITSANNTLTQQYVWDYTGTGANNGYEQRASGATLQPGTAYWIKVLASTDVTMLVPKDNEEGYFTATSTRSASEASSAPEDTEEPPPPPGLSVSFNSTSSDGRTRVWGSGGCFIGTVTPMD
jgi:parallel beta-helix repeat protein